MPPPREQPRREGHTPSESRVRTREDGGESRQNGGRGEGDDQDQQIAELKQAVADMERSLNTGSSGTTFTLDDSTLGGETEDDETATATPQERAKDENEDRDSDNTPDRDERETDTEDKDEEEEKDEPDSEGSETENESDEEEEDDGPWEGNSRQVALLARCTKIVSESRRESSGFSAVFNSLCHTLTEVVVSLREQGDLRFRPGPDPGHNKRMLGLYRKKIHQIKAEALLILGFITEVLKSGKFSIERSFEVKKMSQAVAEDAQSGTRKAEKDHRHAVKQQNMDELNSEDDEVRRRAEERREREIQEELAVLRDPFRLPSLKPPNLAALEEFAYGEGGDEALICRVYAEDGDVRQEDLDCVWATQEDMNFSYEATEELVTPFVMIEPTQPGLVLPEVFVAIPFVLSRSVANSREPVIRTRIYNTWVAIETFDITLEKYKDQHFAVCRLDDISDGCVLVVSTQHRRDFVTFDSKTRKFTSSVDARLSVEVEEGTWKKKTMGVFQVEPVDAALVAEMRQTRVECRYLLSCSPILKTQLQADSFKKPLIVTISCPANPARARQAAQKKAAKEAKARNPVRRGPEVDDEGEEGESRPRKKGEQKGRWYMGGYGNIDDDDSERVLVMENYRPGKWRPVETTVKEVRMDLVRFELPHPARRLAVIRTRPFVATDETRAMCSGLDDYLSLRFCRFIVKHKSDDPRDVAVRLVLEAAAEKHVQELTDWDYSAGPGITKTVVLREGEVVDVVLRGNLRPEDDTPLRLIMNSNITATAALKITPVDRYLQRAYSTFKGIVGFFKRVHVPAEKGRAAGEKQVHLADVNLTIPKSSTTPVGESSNGYASPVILRNDRDPIDSEVLGDLAGKLGDEWTVVAQQLNVQHVRLQAILAKHGSSENMEEPKLEMLITWAKRVPRSMNKATMLVRALSKVGRLDLVEDIRQRQHTMAA